MNSLETNLLAQLTEENEVMTNLRFVIEQEQSLLVKSNIKNIQQLLDKKSKYISNLAALAHRRHLALASAGLAADESGMQTWLEQNPVAEINQAWQKLLQQTRAAKEFNRTNGLLINTQLGRNQSALNVLTGSNNMSSVYGPDGQTRRSGLSRGFTAG